MSMSKQDSEPTWANQLEAARARPTADLKHHAAVSTDNRHRCMDCFCCAALTVIEERANDPIASHFDKPGPKSWMQKERHGSE